MRCQNLLKCQNNKTVQLLRFYSFPLLFLCLLDQEIKNIFLGFEKDQISIEHKEILSRAEFNLIGI